jgi:pyruvate dehydrogenase E1 component alpha subunit
MREAFAKARGGQGPSLIECLTYRHSGHSRADPAKYRPEGELEKWKQHDPLKVYRQRLKDFAISEQAMAEIEAEVGREVDEATKACQAAPSTSTDILFTDVYADGGWAWRN